MFHDDSHTDWDANDKSKNDKINKPKYVKSRHNDARKEHFSIDNSIHVKLDLDFAIDLGNFLLDCDNSDKRFKSFGHNLKNLSFD